MATQAQLAAVQQLYVGYLGRAADSAGQQFWANAIANGTATIASVATGFTLSAEYKAAYGGLTTDALVEKVYNNVLGRTPDAEGKAFWVAALANGKVTADTLVATIVTNLGALDQQTINNKVFVAQTYTDTAGANYNVAAGTASIVGVNSTPASVTAALGNISNGTLAGLTPGVALINAVAAANADKVAYGIATATTNPTFDTLIADGVTPGKDGVVSSADAAAAFTKAQGVVTTLGTNSTAANAALTAQTTTTAQAKDLAVAAGKAANVAGFEAAIANQKALIGTATLADAKAAAATAETAALAGADVALIANAALTGDALAAAVTYATLSSKFIAAGGTAGTDFSVAGKLKAALEAPTVTATEIAAKAALVTELAKLPTYGQSSIDTAAKVAALAASETAVGTVAAPGTAAGTAAAADDIIAYAKEALKQAAAADTVSKITVAETAVAAAKVVVDKYVALDNSINVANAALTKFGADNAAKVAIADASLSANGAVLAASAKSDVFYFGSKMDAAKDLSIGGTAATNFGVGDSIVLGSGYTFNAGALSTGNNNALEVFLVKGSTGTQVVIEATAFGSAATGTVVDASGNVTASPGATVINLVGVTADHLSVANGVVSYV